MSASPRRHRHEGWRLLFSDRLRHRHRRAGTRAGTTRFRVAVRVRAHPYPGQPALAVSGRRRAAEALFPHPRSVRRAVVCRGGDAQAQARHGHCARAAARPDHHREIGGEPRSAFRRPLHFRDRRRVERRGDGEPRRALRDPLQAAARTRAGDEGAVDAGAGRVSRRVRQLRPGLALSQAEAEAASPDPARRGDRLHHPPRGRVLRRLVPAPARGLGARERGGAAARGRARGRTRSQNPLDHGLQRAG